MIASIPVGGLPLGIAITPTGDFAYVTNSFSNSVTVIDIAENRIAVVVLRGGISHQPASRWASSNETSDCRWLCRGVCRDGGRGGGVGAVEAAVLARPGGVPCRPLPKALELFDQAVAADPADVYARYYRAVTRGRLNDVEGAIADLRVVLAAKPDFDQAALDLGVTLVQTGKYREALPWLEQAQRGARSRRSGVAVSRHRPAASRTSWRRRKRTSSAPPPAIRSRHSRRATIRA